MRRLFLCLLISAVLFAFAGTALADEGTFRALLIGVDTFASREDTYPVSTNNVYAMQGILQAMDAPVDELFIPESPITSPSGLTTLIHRVFGTAREGDINLLYLCTHGLYENGQAALLLSDGEEEYRLTPEELEAAFAGVEGTKLLILDACHSGAFIGKGLAEQPEALCFSDGSFKVLTSCGAEEESWFWSDTSLSGQGGFYFTQTLCSGLCVQEGFPADRNRDGSVTMTELYDYLLLNHAASTPQMYPARDDFVLFRYSPEDARQIGESHSPVMDISFSSSVLSPENRKINLEYVAIRPTRVAYQVVYRKDGRWCFEDARLIYDGAERGSGLPGSVSAGRKQRTVNLSTLPERGGYALVQLVTIDEGRVTVHAGRVLCVLPENFELSLSVHTSGTADPAHGREMTIFTAHSSPCLLSVSVRDEAGNTVYRVCHRKSTRPLQMEPEGSVFSWDGCLKDGTPVPPGIYTLYSEAVCGSTVVSACSDPFIIE